MIKVGLTGGIASGKSTVSKILRELGAKIIDADLIAREIVEPHQVAWQDIVAYFGRDVLNSDLTLNRKLLGTIVFNNPKDLKVLNAITHPRIGEKTNELFNTYQEEGTLVTVLDAALLIEGGMTGLVDLVWVVQVDLENQIKRLMKREGISREDTLKRVQSQTSLEEKLRYADNVINNNGSEQELKVQVVKLWEDLING